MWGRSARAEEGGGASHRTCQLGFIQFRCFSVDLDILNSSPELHEINHS